MLRTDEERRLFFISGFLSLLLFSFLLFLFLHMLFENKKLKTYGLTKKHYISVSLKNVSTLSKHDTHRSMHTQKQKKKPLKKKRKIVDPVSEDLDVDSLFNNIWTKKVDTSKKAKRKVDAKRIAEIEKSITSPALTEKSSQTSVHKAEKSEKKASSGEEVNEYSAKIHAIVYDHFYPPANSEGEEVKAVIELSPLGKVLDFRILNYSANEALNEEADHIKERIKNVIFPKNPDNESARIVIILKPEAKE